MNAATAISFVSKRTDEIILFHSATGKDSIVCLDMLSKKFRKVVCCFMFIIKDSVFETKYIRWAESKYPNCKFIFYPHFVLSEIIKYGLYGVAKKTEQRKYRLADIMKEAQAQTGIQWICEGIKKYDGLERRIMLNMTGSVDVKNKKLYPLADWTNKDCLNYIKKNKLVNPVQTANTRTQGFNLTDGDFLLWLKNNYPQDAKEVFRQFPLTKRYLYEKEYESRTIQEQ